MQTHAGLIGDVYGLDTAILRTLRPAPFNSCGLMAKPIATSPTNLALKLLVDLGAKNSATLARTIHTIARLDYHAPTGLFFNRYHMESPFEVRDTTLSSIDNAHLAFAFYRIAASTALTHPGISSLAASLFERMDMHFFYDPADGLFFGAARRDSLSKKWILDSWKYRYFGSESRSLYSLGYAFNWVQDKDFLQKTFDHLIIEVHPSLNSRKKMLKLWDGGAFQLFLPELLIRESQRSQILRDAMIAYSAAVLREGEKRFGGVPAAFSASQSGIEPEWPCGTYPCYNGHAGLLSETTSINDESREPFWQSLWESVMTPHAAVMAALPDPAPMFDKLAAIKNIRGTNAIPLYVEGLGWLDGYHVSGSFVHAVVPAQLSLDQGLLALALMRLEGVEDSWNFSVDVEYRLDEFYLALDQSLLSGWPGKVH